jgi:hypothetical protein
MFCKMGHGSVVGPCAHRAGIDPTSGVRGHADRHGSERATAFREYCRPVITMQWRRERVKLRRGIGDFSNGERASSLV